MSPRKRPTFWVPFWSPKVYKVPPKVTLQQETTITTNVRYKFLILELFLPFYLGFTLVSETTWVGRVVPILVCSSTCLTLWTDDDRGPPS